jgi:hypothetical protein
MSLRPIDLQNLFGRLNEISKQQAAIHEASHHAQQVAGSEIAERSANQQKRVTKTEDIEEGPDKVKKVDEEEVYYKQKHNHDKESSDDSNQETPDDIFRDPDLGNKVDIST